MENKQRDQEKNLGNQPNREKEQHNQPGHQGQTQPGHQGQSPNRGTERQNPGTQNQGDRQNQSDKEKEYSKR